MAAETHDLAHDLLTAIPISIVAAALLALLARAVRQPLILGYIAAGIVLGPHLGLRLVTDEKSIEVISEIGLIFLLFIIGLEINVPRLLQAGRTIIVSGVLQFPLCAALAWYVLGRRVPGEGQNLDGLYLAVALSLSSTLIVVKLLFDKFEISTFGGQVTLGILVFQDLWAIVFMALQPNLDHLQGGPLLRSLLAGLAVLGGAVLLSRFVLPTVFRWIATSAELVLIAAVAWCFLVAGVADHAGLSKEMGALIAGLVLAAFPYSVEVASRLSGVRDFFVTLFFVTLGLKVPVPSTDIVVLAGAAALVVIATRAVVLYPLFALLRLDTRTAGVVAVNLSQVSEFSLVIVSLGAGLGHVSPGLQTLVLYTLLLTAVLSTYGIYFNHDLATAMAQLLRRVGMPIWRTADPGTHGAVGRSHPDIFLLGVWRDALAFLQHMERGSPGIKARITAIDFNPETLERLQAAGIECHYGDISHIETLRHAGVANAAIAVSTISDAYLRGVDNRRLLQLVRSLAPKARVVVTGDTPEAAEALYAAGADYVLIPSALSAEHLYGLLREGSGDVLDQARRRQATEVFGRRS
jgi:Kef-type K+ transport system membrane component KefB